MLTRRGFAGCALCAVTGFVAIGAEARNAPAGLKRTIITRTDGPVDGYETVNVRVDLDAGTLVARHTHPGIKSSYVVEGGLELSVDGQGTRTFEAGMIPSSHGDTTWRQERRQAHDARGHLCRRKRQAPRLAGLKPGGLESQQNSSAWQPRHRPGDERLRGFERRIRGARRPTAERLAEHELVSRNGTPFQPGIARMLEA